MIKLIDLLLENSDNKYDYGCVMLYFNFPEMFKIQDMINPDDLYEEEGDKTYGFEDEPHVTLLFGLHDSVSLDEIKHTLGKFTYSDCLIEGASIFNSKNYDVLKFDVSGVNLAETNSELKKFPYTNEHKKYHPHMTIAYVKKGKGQMYADKINKLSIKYKLMPQYAVYSQADGTQNKIEIKIK